MPRPFVYREPFVVVVPLPGGLVQHHDQPPGVLGHCYPASGRYMLVEIDRQTGRWRGNGAVYPSACMARDGARTRRRQHRRHALKVNGNLKA